MLDFALYDSKSKIWISPTIYQSMASPSSSFCFYQAVDINSQNFLGFFFKITEQYRSHIVMKSINLGTNHACHLCSFCRMRAEWVGLYIRSRINWSRMALLTWKSAGFFGIGVHVLILHSSFFVRFSHCKNNIWRPYNLKTLEHLQ